jgi:poly-gamma-glutamate capsule biosynthesis protein CapA/YwtB (metallophosphatase superfamily)
LIEGGVDLVHGHSSHHPRPIEVHRGKLILHGCGDLIDDYEGIHGYEEYRDDLRVAYLPSLDRRSGRLIRLRLLVFKVRRMRLEHASAEDVEWLRGVLDRVSRPLGASLTIADGAIELT